MGFSNDDDPYGAMFAAADAEQREKAAASDKEWAARGVVKVAPEPEEEKEPSAISASRRVEAPSRHRRDSCPSDEVVGGFFFEFEAIRTEPRCSAQVMSTSRAAWPGTLVFHQHIRT